MVSEKKTEDDSIGINNFYISRSFYDRIFQFTQWYMYREIAEKWGSLTFCPINLLELILNQLF